MKGFHEFVALIVIEITLIRVSVVSLVQISGCARSGLQYSAWSVARTRFCNGCLTTLTNPPGIPNRRIGKRPKARGKSDFDYDCSNTLPVDFQSDS
ncbi:MULTISPECIES: hypothetical protein [unclassified Synechococcus]|uniref:hypothetical protein n=1 Tax=unclassified Synechococcus TaxID=2626047 RepID=UPI0039B0A553